MVLEMYELKMNNNQSGQQNIANKAVYWLSFLLELLVNNLLKKCRMQPFISEFSLSSSYDEKKLS